jgi:DNA-binding GntR family transcriptional regulator
MVSGLETQACASDHSGLRLKFGPEERGLRHPSRLRAVLLLARSWPPDEAGRLQIAAGTPVVEICRVAVDAAGIPVEVNEMTADSSAYIFRYEFDA